MRNLTLRIVSALVLAPLAIGAAFLGGWVFVAFWTIGALAVWWEWVHLVSPDGHRVAYGTGAGAILLAALLAGTDRMEMAVLIAALGALGVTVTAGRHPAWIAGGALYAGALLLASIAVRLRGEDGFLAIVFLFAVVWTTDVAGYFVGRALGGPKLAPSISPKKTWSGAAGGLAGAMGAAAAFAHLLGADVAVAAMLGGLMSVMAQGGDLFESKVKRLFHAKDSSGLIPGHGGVMDRVDGYVAAAVTFALVDACQSWLDGAGPKFLVW